MVLEYIKGTSLKAYLAAQKTAKLLEHQVLPIFRQLVSAVAYCHAKGIIHRDLKLEHVLVTRTLSVKIIDFGFAVTQPNARKLRMLCGTPVYMAPEILRKQEYMGGPVDVWSLGVIFYVLLSGAFPFPGTSLVSAQGPQTRN